MLTNIYLCTKVHLLSFIRNKNAFFWAMTFPIFLYLVFYSIFNGFGQDNYAIFLLTGILGMTIIADGLFGVGSVIQINYRSGTIRQIKKMPVNILIYFLGMILNRFLILSCLFLFLNVCSYFVAGEYISLSAIPNVVLGVFLGLWVFSFIGLSLSYMNIKSESEKGIKNLVYFLILFSSNALYQIGAFNPTVEKIADYLPMNSLLNILRSEPVQWLNIAFWMAVPMIIFYFLFTKTQYSR